MVLIKTTIKKGFFVIGLYSLEHEDYKFIEISNSENGYKYLLALMKTIAKENKYIITFNGKHYDMPLIQYLVKNDFSTIRETEIVYLLRRFSDYITNDEEWYKEKDYYQYKYNNYKHIDLLYYGNGSNLYSDIYANNIKRSDTNDVEVAKKQLKNDLIIMKKLYEESLDEIKQRQNLSDMFDVNIFDLSRPKIMEKILKVNFTEKEIIYEDRSTTADVTDIANQYMYENHEINTFKDYLLTLKNVKNTKSVNYAFSIDNIKCNISSGIMKINSTHKGFIEDVYIIDVKSMYPSMLLKHEIVPSHLNKDILLSIYQKIYNLKMNTKNNDLYKSMLVSLVGMYNSGYSWLNSYESWISVVLHSTMYMLGVVDKILSLGHEIVFANLDSVCFKANDIDESMFNDEHLLMDVSFYHTMIIKDYNNYIAVGEKVMTSGMFKEANKYPIIAKAVRAYVVDGYNYVDFIKDRINNLLDFCTIYNAPDDHDVIYMSEVIQNTNRVYVSLQGDYLYKAKHGKITRMTKEKVKLANVSHGDRGYINYDWYISQVQKLLFTEKTLF